MKKHIVYGGLISVLLAVPFFVSAAQFKAEEQPSLGTGETVQGNLYMAGGNVSSSGTVRGDLVIAGGNLLVTGPVSNDLLIGGGSITVTSDIGGDVRIGGGNITLQGKIAGDAVIGGGQVSISGAGVGGDVAIGGGAISISAPVNGNVKIAGGDVKIDAPIKGNVDIQAEKVTLGPKAVISGDLVYSAKELAVIQDGATVQGKTDFKKREETSPAASPFPFAAVASIALVVKLLMSIVGALAFFWLFTRYANELAKSFATQTLENLGIGLVTFIVLPIASVILLVTVIGIPIGMLGLLAYAALLIFGSLTAPIAVGSVVHKWIWKPAGYEVNWWIVLMGVAVYFVLGLIPFVGWIVKFGILLITLGVITRVKWSVAKNWH